MRVRTTREWMVASLGVALLIVLAVRTFGEPGEKLGIALRSTARWSYCLFWPAYVGSALATLFGPRFRPLAKRARDLGLSFASAHLAHLGLVTFLLMYNREPFPRGSLIFFGIGVFCIYLLALLSIKQFSPFFGTRTGRIVRTLAMEYIAFAFLVDFAKNPFKGGLMQLVAYLPFLALAVAGPLLRLAAAIKRLTDSRRRLAIAGQAGAGSMGVSPRS